MEGILIDGLGFDWKDRSAFEAAPLDSRRAFSGAVFEIYNLSDRETGWMRDQPGPREIAADLDDILKAVRHLRDCLDTLDAGTVELWGRTALGTPDRDGVHLALKGLVDFEDMGEDGINLWWRLHGVLDEVKPPLAALHEVAHTAAIWRPGGGKGPGQPPKRFAYGIASIVADLFRRFGKRPTYSSDSASPSPFTRTLQAVFSHLGIKAHPDDIGKWAVGRYRIRKRSKTAKGRQRSKP